MTAVASGDLSKLKLVPAVYEMYADGLLSDKFVLVGYARSTHRDKEKKIKPLLTAEEMKELVELAANAYLTTQSPMPLSIRVASPFEMPSKALNLRASCWASCRRRPTASSAGSG